MFPITHINSMAVLSAVRVDFSIGIVFIPFIKICWKTMLFAACRFDMSAFSLVGA